MVKRNETTSPNPDAASKAQESESHDLIQDPSFPLGSIGKGKSWQVDGDYEHYMESDHPYVGLAPGASLWQDITLPVKANPAADGRPDFWLGCEYDTGRLTDCRLEMYDFTGGKEGTLLQKRVMEGIEPDVSQVSDALVNWTRLPLQRIENLGSTVTAIRIKFIAGKGNNRLSLRNTDLDVRLPPLAATLSLVVDPQGLKIEQAAPPFKFCHGAVHRLGISEVETDSWLQQKASLSWHGEMLPTEYALQANPPFNRGVPDEESFQSLEDVTAWAVSSNAKVDANSGTLALGISCYWQAEIRDVAASVGDYVNDLSTIAGGDSALIIDDESANKATLTTTVFNHFTPERKVEKMPVEWRVNGRLIGTVLTDERGQSQIDYKPERGDEGDANQAQITAIAKNALGEASRQDKNLRVFTTTPWLDQVQMLLDGKEVDLKNLGLHLSRGDKARTLVLKPKAIPGNFFIGRDVTLTSPEDSAGKLGISFEPSTAREMPESGLEWLIEGGGTSGFFAFEANATGLNVPFVLKGVQMSQNLSDEADLTVPDAAPGNAPLFWRTQAGTVALVPKKDSPLAGLGLETWLTFVKVNLEQSSIPAIPAYAAKRALPAAGLQWSLKGGAASGVFGLEVHVEGFTQPWVVSKAVLLSQQLSDEAEIELPQSPMLFQRGASQPVTVAVKANSPLAGLGLKGTMKFLDGTVKQANMSASPAYDTLNAFTSAGKLTWRLTGGNVSGTFGFEISVEGFSKPLRLEVAGALLMSTTLSDEAAIKIEGLVPAGTVVFNREKTYKVELVPKADSPLGLSRLKGWSAMSLTSEPERMLEREMTPEGLEWKVTAPGSSSKFDLSLHMRGFTVNGLVIKDCLILSEDLRDEAELEVEGSNKGGVGYFWRNTAGSIRLVPKSGSPLKGSALKAALTFVESQGGFTQAQLGANPNYKMPQAITDAGSQWALAPGSKSGYFDLQIAVDHIEKPLLRRGMILSKDLRDEVQFEYSDLKREAKVFFYDVRTELRMSFKSGSPLPLATDLNVSLSYVGKDLPSTQMRSAPNFDSKVPINGKDMLWALTASRVRGLFGLKLNVDKFDTSVEWPVCGTLSGDLSDEFKVSDSLGMFLIRGKNESVTVTYDGTYLQALGVEFYIATSLNNGAAIFEPPLGRKLIPHSGGVTTVTVVADRSKSGAGTLDLACDLYSKNITLKKICVHGYDVWDDFEFTYADRRIVAGDVIYVLTSHPSLLKIRSKWPGIGAFITFKLKLQDVIFSPVKANPAVGTVMSFVNEEKGILLGGTTSGSGRIQIILLLEGNGTSTSGSLTYQTLLG